MTEAVGHSVRLTYFCTGVADLAMLTNDEGYRLAVDRIWANTIHRKYYLTGGVGTLPSKQGEAFSVDFDLPNNGYCEACAGCGVTARDFTTRKKPDRSCFFLVRIPKSYG